MPSNLRFRIGIFPPSGIFAFLGALAWLNVAGAPAAADILHLASGGTVEGEILETSEQFYKIRTGNGIITLPADTIKEIEKAPSPFEEYQKRNRQTAQTASEQMKLADWCEQHGLNTERRKHLLRALELDPDCTSAHEALGHVRVGLLWVDGRPAEPAKNGRRNGNTDKNGSEKNGADKNHEKRDAKRDAEPPDRDDAKVAAAIQGDWARRIRSIKSSLLDSPLDRLVQNGRTKILEIRDPLAILPLTRELGRANRFCRELLIEALSGFAEDEATLNLAIIALLDSEDELRARALSQLVRRNDPRVAAQFRTALGSNNDLVVRRAAAGLGALNVREAVPDLINTLTARRRKMVEVPVRRYLQEMPLQFTDSRIQLSKTASIVYSPQIGIGDVAGTASLEAEYRMEEVTVYRTEVLEALKQITGHNFGFEDDKWRRWYEEQKS